MIRLIAFYVLLAAATVCNAQFRQQCPGGSCPAPQFVAPLPPSVVPQQMPSAKPAGDGWTWEYVPGIGHAWTRPSQPVAVAPPATATATPKVVNGPLSDLRQRVLLRVVRERAADQLVRDGFRGKKVDRAEAERLVERVDDATVLSAAKFYGAPLDGSRIEALIDWIVNHKDEIRKLIEFLISLIGLLS